MRVLKYFLSKKIPYYWEISINIIIASQNNNKILELESKLKKYKISIKKLSDYTSKSPEENGQSFHENALLKARWAKSFVGETCSILADDSGLCIKNLNGAPGIHSARWVIKNNYNQVFNKIKQIFLNLGMKINDQPAEFICVLAYINTEKKESYYEGRLKGKLTFPPKGKYGFGYDPIFIPFGFDKTLAEITVEEKNRISHREIALKHFIFEQLLSNL